MPTIPFNPSWKKYEDKISSDNAKEARNATEMFTAERNHELNVDPQARKWEEGRKKAIAEQKPAWKKSEIKKQQEEAEKPIKRLLNAGKFDYGLKPTAGHILIGLEDTMESVTDIIDVFKKYKPDYVYHYAACVGVERTLSKPLEVLSDIDGIRNILNLCIEYGVKRVFYSSSSEVYGEPVVIPQNEETTPLNSRLTYAVVKNLGEVMLKAYHKEYGLPYTIFRFFNTYGQNQSPNFGYFIIIANVYYLISTVWDS